MVKKIRSALTRKLGPAPAWVWLALAAAGIYVWRKHSAAATLATGATGTASIDGSTQGIGSTYDTGLGGGGGAGLIPPDVPNLDTGAPVSWDPLQQPAGPGTAFSDLSPAVDQTAFTQQPGGGAAGGSASTPATRPKQEPFKNAGGYATVLSNLLLPGLGGPVIKPGSYGGLRWGGQVFRTQAKFMSWLSGHGGSLGDLAINHPAAYTLFLTLPKGTPTASAPRPRASTGRHAAQPVGRPISVRGVPAREHLAASKASQPARASRVVSAPKAQASAGSVKLIGKPPAAVTATRSLAPAPPPPPPPPKATSSPSPAAQSRVAAARQANARVERIGY